MKVEKCVLRFALLFAGLFFLPCLAGGQVKPPTSKAPQPSLLGAPEIIVEHGSGAGKALIYLRNNSAAPMAVSLSGVISSSAKPTGARISFAKETDPGSASEVFDFTVPKDATVKLWAIVTAVWDAADSEAELRNKNTPTGDKIRIRNFPFNIKLGGPDPDKAELTLVKDQIATIIIRNEDPIPYSLAWRLRIDGRDVCGNNVNIDRNSISLLECRPSVSFSASRISNLFKSESTEENQLLLYPQVSMYPQVSNRDPTGVSPWKSFPVKASLNYFSLFTQQVFSYVVIVLVLILGGLTSLFLSQALPNRIKRLNIQDQLDSLARATSSFSSKIDSKLQVTTRVERSRLRKLLESRNAFSPDFSSVVTECEQRIPDLSSRVALIQQMDLVFGRLAERVRLGDVPPSKIDAIEADLKNAKVLLTKSQLTEDEEKTAMAVIGRASIGVDTLNQEDVDFGKNLAANAVAITKAMVPLATNAAFRSIYGKEIGSYNTLSGIVETQTIAPASYCSIDMAIEKMKLVLAYVRLVENTQIKAAKDRLTEREDKLVEFLQPESRRALKSARLLVREMKDDVYTKKLEEALTATPQDVSIGMDPSFAYDQVALEFCVCFHSAAVDDAAAREEWSCSWDFGDGLKEKGWSVSHYFILPKLGIFKRILKRVFKNTFKKTGEKTFHVKATLRDADGKQISDKHSKTPVVISRQVKVAPSILGNLGERSWTEGLKLSAALLIAVFGLVAGAREELLKLDVLPGLIAVFLVGFGADTIKNLLTTKA